MNEVSYTKNDGPDVTFSWMKLPVWNTHYFAGILGMKSCVWKCNVWSIASNIVAPFMVCVTHESTLVCEYGRSKWHQIQSMGLFLVYHQIVWRIPTEVVGYLVCPLVIFHSNHSTTETWEWKPMSRTQGYNLIMWFPEDWIILHT